MISETMIIFYGELSMHAHIHLVSIQGARY